MTTENETELFDDGFLSADITVEDPIFGSAYPVVQWANGDKTKSKSGGIEYTGGFFISADQGIEPPDGFEPYTLMTSEGVEVIGFAASMITGSVLRYRRCWMSEPEGENSLSRRFSWNEYDDACAYGKVRGVAHILFALKGSEEPVLLAFRGMVAKQMLGQGRQRGIIPNFGSKILGSAKRIARKNKRNKVYPLCTFELTIGAEVSADGKPVFTKVGTGKNTSNITYPMWRDEPKELVSESLLGRLFVGNEALGLYQDWHTEADDWTHSWDSAQLAARAAARTPAVAAAVAAPVAQDGVPADQEVPF
jgi:hypothetical protein